MRYLSSVFFLSSFAGFKTDVEYIGETIRGMSGTCRFFCSYFDGSVAIYCVS